jgi:hypothetical protein
VYGWFTGPSGGMQPVGAYFVLENFYALSEVRYLAAETAALHTRWIDDEPRLHELASLQSAFSNEWLFYRDDPRAPAELRAYAQAELGVGEVNVRYERLTRFSRLQPDWTFYSPNFERPVLRALSKRWPLDYRLDLD